jgi:hypothetical protein
MHARIHFLSSHRRPADAPLVAHVLRGRTAPDHPRQGTATATVTPSAASAGDPTVISDWNAIAVATLSADTTKQPVEDILYMAFVQAAVYNAVVGVEGRYAPYRFHAHAPRGTSAQAAAVAAAHKILVTYVPSAQATLDADYAASLAKLPDGTAKTRGIAFGTRAADSLIRLRAHDGRNAPILFTQPPAPGSGGPLRLRSCRCRRRGSAS